MVGFPERDVGRKKKEQKDCLGGILSIGFSQCISILYSFNLLSFKNSLAQSLHVKFDCYLQNLKPEIVRLQPVSCLIFCPQSKQLNPLLPHYLHPLCTFQHIIFQCSGKTPNKNYASLQYG